MALFIQETYINKTRNHLVGESEVFDAYTDSPGEVYRSSQREYGRCTGSVYIDRPNGKTKKIGWMFVKKAKYTDCDETYLQETWITLHRRLPKQTTKYYYR